MQNFKMKHFGGSFELKNKTVLEAKGEDCLRFFKGQLTNNSSILKNQFGQLSARLDRGGKIQTFFYLLKKTENHFFFLIDNEIANDLLEDLNKFIIMDDVELVSLGEKKVYAKVSYEEPREKEYSIPYCSEQIVVTWEEIFEKTISDEELEFLELNSAQPIWNKTIFKNQLINETILSLFGLDLNKGCFLGQETVAKIEVGRGASYFPVGFKCTEPFSDLVGKEFKVNDRKGGEVLSSTQEEDFFQLSLFREFRIFNRSLEIEFENKKIKGTVVELPIWETLSSTEKAQWLYEEGGLEFQKNNEDLAIKLMERAISIDASLADAYESLGVILGRHEKYNEAIKLMDQLLEVNPDSVMAHTNKSLYLMKIGKIEEAEEEKAQATVKGFAALGKESQRKKEIEALAQKEKEEIERRKGMFLQVLEIDAEDTIANYGLGDIYFKEMKYQDALEHLKKVLEVDDKYSVAYLLLGKTYLALEDKGLAKEIFKKGIEIASKKGDLMPANEMQAKLAQL